MTLKEYIEKAKMDRNLFWRLSSGEQQNLLDEAIEKLDSLRVQATPEIVTLADRYNELLHAVAKKFPGESRHETALRYIRQAEEVHAGPSKDAT